MKKHLFLYWLLAACTFYNNFIFAQNSFPKTYDFNAPAAAIYDLIVHHDTIITVGLTYKDGGGSNQQGVYISLMDSCGNLVGYEKFFDENNKSLFMIYSQVIPLDDGGYCFCGTTAKAESCMYRTDGNGKLIYLKKVSAPAPYKWLYFETVLEVNKELYWIGTIQDSLGQKNDICIIKTSLDGDLIFTKIYGSSACEIYTGACLNGNRITVAAAKGYVCGASLNHTIQTWLFEIDSNGKVLWEWLDTTSTKEFGGVGLKKVPDNGWIYSGAFFEAPDGIYDYKKQCMVVKLDSNLNKEWVTYVGEPTSDQNRFSDLFVNPDGTIIAGGQYWYGIGNHEIPPGQLCGYVAKLSPTGEILWTNCTRVYWDSVHPTRNYLYSLDRLSSGNIIAGGYHLREDTIVKNEAWLTKISQSGYEFSNGDGGICLPISVQENPERLNEIKIFPNPAHQALNIFLPKCAAGSLKIWNVAGQLVSETPDLPGETVYPISTNDWAAGIYFFQIFTDHNAPVVKKVVIAH